MVGWPAKGISAMLVKMSMEMVVEGVDCSCRKTISERLNSLAMDCFWDWVRVVDSSAGTRIMATGLPAYRVEVKTSRVVKDNFISERN